MTTEPTEKHKEEAREIVEGVFGPRGSSPIYATAGRLFDELQAKFDAALSSRDTEIREVLGNLRTTTDCWCLQPCIAEPVHSPACLATRALWEKVQN